MPFISALKRQKQEDLYKIKDSLVYTVSSRVPGQPRLYNETLFQNNKVG